MRLYLISISVFLRYHRFHHPIHHFGHVFVRTYLLSIALYERNHYSDYGIIGLIVPLYALHTLQCLWIYQLSITGIGINTYFGFKFNNRV